MATSKREKGLQALLRERGGGVSYALSTSVAVPERTLCDIVSYIAIRNNKSACKPDAMIAVSMATASCKPIVASSLPAEPTAAGIPGGAATRTGRRVPVCPDLRGMALGAAAPNLQMVLVRQAPAPVVAAVPLEPAARIVWMQPSLAPPPDKGWLASTPKYLRLGSPRPPRVTAPPSQTSWRETPSCNRSCTCRRRGRGKHLLWRELGPEVLGEVVAGRSRQRVAGSRAASCR